MCCSAAWSVKQMSDVILLVAGKDTSDKTPKLSFYINTDLVLQRTVPGKIGCITSCKRLKGMVDGKNTLHANPGKEDRIKRSDKGNISSTGYLAIYSSLRVVLIL